MLHKFELNQFTGSETFYRHWQGLLLYTEGVLYVAEKGNAFWLIDAIASYQHSAKITEDKKLQEIQFWELQVKEDQSATLFCWRDSDDLAFTQEIGFTDFPLERIEFYLTNSVLMLPSEY